MALAASGDEGGSRLIIDDRGGVPAQPPGRMEVGGAGTRTRTRMVSASGSWVR